MTRHPRSFGSTVLFLALTFGAGAPVAGKSPSPLTADDAASPAAASLTYVAFGDSWAYGAHCNGCRPFPGLYAYGLETMTGHPIEFVNLTTNGGGAESLLADIRSSQTIRDAVSRADIVIIATGMNDLDAAFKSYAAGTCGGADHVDCFREAAVIQRARFDSILTEIEGLRKGAPTAIRLITTSNEFLTDPQWPAGFGTTAGVPITQMMADLQCELAAAHGAACVDLGSALNGPDLATPADVDTQEGMQAVADAILASGLDELAR